MQIDGDIVAQCLTPSVLGTFAFAFLSISRRNPSLLCARYFAAAFFAATLGLVCAIVLTSIDASRWLWAASDQLYLVAAVLLTAGFHIRRRRDVPWTALVVIALFTCAFDVILRAVDYESWRRVITISLGTAALLAMSIPTMLPARRLADKRLLMLIPVFGITILAAGLFAVPDGSGAFDADGFEAVMNLAISIGALLIALTLVAEYNQRQMDTLARESRTDPLTNALNRRGFEERARRVVADCLAKGEAACVVVADIDHFKRINDTYGHPTGDVAIRSFAGMLIEAVGSSALVGRLGGEEFGVVIPNCDLDVALCAAEQLRVRAAALDLTDHHSSLALTATFGVAEAEADYEDAFSKADKWLLEGKRTGRNRVASMRMSGQPLAA